MKMSIIRKRGCFRLSVKNSMWGQFSFMNETRDLF